MADYPLSLLRDERFVDVIVEILPKRPNLFGWLNDEIKANKRILDSYKALPKDLQ